MSMETLPLTVHVYVLACWCLCEFLPCCVYMWDPRSYRAGVLLRTLVCLCGYVSGRHTVRGSRHPAFPTKLSQADSVPALPSLPAHHGPVLHPDVTL